MSFFDRWQRPVLGQTPEDDPGLLARGVKAAAEGVANLMPQGGAPDVPTSPQVTISKPISQVEASRFSGRRSLPRGSALAPPATKVKGDITIKNVPPQVMSTTSEAVLAAGVKERELAFDWQVGQNTLVEAQASVTALKQWSAINENDYEGRKALINEAFPKWRRANEQLSQDIDDARMLKVNPHNYMQSVGRAGRVASVLAVGIGQLAAGAGNTNAVYQRLEAAINRDIAGQKNNIDLVWRGISAKRQLTQDEIDLLETEFNFTDRAKAVAYTALAAQMGAAKQHARSETIRLNMDMIESRALGQAVIAGGEARAKSAMAHIDAKVNGVYHGMQKVRKIKAMQAAILASAEAEPGQAKQFAAGQAILAKPLGAGIAPGDAATGAPAVAPTPTAQPVAAPPSAAASVARDQRRPAPTSATPAPPAALDPNAPVPPPSVAQDAPLGPTTAAPAAAPKAKPAAAPFDAEAVVDAIGDKNLSAPQARSYHRAAQISRGQNPTGPTLAEMINHVRDPKTKDYVIAEDLNDADEIAKHLPTPLKSNPVYYKTVDGEQVFQKTDWETDVRHIEQLRDFPEALMVPRPLIDLHTGERKRGYNNVLDMGDGTNLHIKADKESLLSSDAARTELETEIRRVYLAADQLAKAANIYQEGGGTKSFMGIRISSTEGLTWKPVNPDATAQEMTMRRTFLETGIQAIKQLDEGGRLSNEDVGFGRELVAVMNENQSVAWDMITAMYAKHFKKPGDLSQIRLAAGRVFSEVVRSYLSQLDTVVSPAVVMSGDAIDLMRRRAERVRAYPPKAEERFRNQTAREEEARVKKATEDAESTIVDRFLEAGVSPNPVDKITFPYKEIYRAGKSVFDSDNEE